MKYFIKEARRRRKNDGSLGRGLGFGAIAGAAAVLTSHPLEHKLYGKGKNVWKHLGARLVKGTMASTASFGAYHYLTQNENKIKNWNKRVKQSSSRKYFK